jgi:hypothetical protein
MNRDAAGWISLALVLIALILAFLRHYYIAWAVIALEVALLTYAMRTKK